MLKLIILLCLISISTTQEVYNINKHWGVIHLKTFGHGDPVLIINGGPGMNSDGFKYLASIIGKKKRAIIYDQRGTGQSYVKAVTSTYIDIDSMIMDIEIIRKFLNINEWVILGHSFGGMLASYYTSKYPNRVKALILSSSGGVNMDLFTKLNITSHLSQLERDSLNYWNNKIAHGDQSYIARYNRGRFLGHAYIYDKSNLPIIAERLTQSNLAINRMVFQSMRRIRFDCSEALRNYDRPVIIIQGKNDIVPVSIAKYSSSIFQNSSLVLLDKCAHYGWLDQPERYFKVLDNFFNNLN